MGEGCQRFSEIWRKPRGLFIGYPNKHRIDQMLADARYDDVRCIVVSDGERILDAERRFENWHQPNGTRDARLLCDYVNSSHNVAYLFCGLDFGNQDEIG